MVDACPADEHDARVDCIVTDALGDSLRRWEGGRVTLSVAVVIPLLLAVFVVALLVGRALRAPALAQTDEEKQRLIEAAKTEAESLKRQAALDAKELAQKARADVEAQQKARQQGLDRQTAELTERERELDRRRRDLERQNDEMAKSEKQIAAREAAAEVSARAAAALAAEAKARLEKTAGLSQAEAREALTAEIRDEARLAAVAEVKRIEDDARTEAEAKSKTIISAAIQRYAGEYVAERTVATVPLPSDDMKGRIIGREGRNIRAIEAATGVDLIIDDTPEAVVISCFNPVRREIARLALTRLIADGRIHPTRIEEIASRRRPRRSSSSARTRASRRLWIWGLGVCLPI